jgi:hypothetical protein
MATAGEMIKVIADAIARPQATVTSYYAVLRKGGFISTTGRGRSAQHLSSLDAARILIVMLSADSLQEGEAVTKLVGELRHAQYDRAMNKLGEIQFEDALASIIEFHADLVHGRAPPAGSVLGNLRNTTEVRVTATHLKAEIVVGGRESFFIDESGINPPIAYPDDWAELPVEDRLVLRAIMEGMSVTRTIDHHILNRIAAAMP